jgi:uncharacterized protein (UPF0248 family)
MVKVYLCFLIFLLFSSCSSTILKTSQQDKLDFLYILPFEVEKKVCNIITGFESKNKNYLFLLLTKDNYYELFVIPLNEEDNRQFGFLKIDESNRRLLVDDRTYPLVFQTDIIFGSTLENIESMRIREEKLNRYGYSIRRGAIINYHRAVSIKFKRSGEIL